MVHYFCFWTDKCGKCMNDILTFGCFVYGDFDVSCTQKQRKKQNKLRGTNLLHWRIFPDCFVHWKQRRRYKARFISHIFSISFLIHFVSRTKSKVIALADAGRFYKQRKWYWKPSFPKWWIAVGRGSSLLHWLVQTFREMATTTW